MRIEDTMNFDDIFRAVWADVPRWKVELWCNAQRAIQFLREFQLCCVEDGKMEEFRKVSKFLREINRAQDSLLLESSTIH